jgi:hypothetical protein
MAPNPCAVDLERPLIGHDEQSTFETNFHKSCLELTQRVRPSNQRNNPAASP